MRVHGLFTEGGKLLDDKNSPARRATPQLPVEELEALEAEWIRR